MFFGGRGAVHKVRGGATWVEREQSCLSDKGAPPGGRGKRAVYLTKGSHLGGQCGQKGLLGVQQTVLFLLDALPEGGKEGVRESNQHHSALPALGNSALLALGNSALLALGNSAVW